jgi:3-deoxy-manno-octulosonate cytidylyltransferase (CMP-KDO synthetase)
MIEHVYRRAAQAEGLARVVVLTDDERIATVVEDFGGDVEMTPDNCRSGTDRIAYAARHWQGDAVVNIQGDEPLIDPNLISDVALHLANHPNDPVVTVAAEADSDEAENSDVVKVVIDNRGYALYFSRASIPFRRAGSAPPLKHIGIYGYQHDSLLRIADLQPSPLEKMESLEQLRALENGIPIRVLKTTREVWWGVDTAEDLARTARYLKSQKSSRDIES